MRILYFSDNSSDHNYRFLEKFVSHGFEVVFLDATQDATAARPLPPGVRGRGSSTASPAMLIPASMRALWLSLDLW